LQETSTMVRPAAVNRAASWPSVTTPGREASV
jgi:hypothetical protein